MSGIRDAFDMHFCPAVLGKQSLNDAWNFGDGCGHEAVVYCSDLVLVWRGFHIMQVVNAFFGIVSFEKRIFEKPVR